MAHLRIVQSAGGFLAVTGDERHGSAFVEQGHCSYHLLRAHIHFSGQALFNRR
ncbi:hypothetical protein GALL_507220 [mine drainage metagenome]|uniref:Uncharacterized protein n=1 Tax=mine drainage metagenome TaxID=410659 RepID=A0A1J5PAF0_9ZZZZ